MRQRRNRRANRDRSRLVRLTIRQTLASRAHARANSTRRANQRFVCPPLPAKIFRLIRRANQIYKLRRPGPKRGASAVVTNVGPGCGGRESVGRARDRRAVQSVSSSQRAGRTTQVAYGKTVWSRLPLLVPSCRWRYRFRPETMRHQAGSDGDKRELVAGEITPYAVKPLRGGCRSVSAEPVCSCAHLLALLHTRPRVQRAPGIPCSLFSRGANFVQSSGALHAARSRSLI